MLAILFNISSSLVSQILKPLDDVLPTVPWAFTCRDRNGWGTAFERLAFHRHVDFDVLARRSDTDVSEPGFDDVEFDAGLKEMHGGRVTHSVRTDAL